MGQIFVAFLKYLNFSIVVSKYDKAQFDNFHPKLTFDDV